MGKIDITPAGVHAMGNCARGVADHPLTAAGKAMTAAYEDEPGAKLGGLMTDNSLGMLVSIWECHASTDVENLRAVATKLHSSANAAANGDAHSTDEFKYVPVHYPRGGGRMEYR